MKKIKLLVSSLLLTGIMFSSTPISAAYNSFANTGSRTGISPLNSNSSTRISVYVNANLKGTSTGSTTQAIGRRNMWGPVWWDATYATASGKTSATGYYTGERYTNYNVDVKVTGYSTYNGNIQTIN